MKKIFRIEEANDYFSYLKNLTNVDSIGLDSTGRIYVHYLNGITDRYTRTAFIKEARVFFNRGNVDILHDFNYHLTKTDGNTFTNMYGDSSLFEVDYPDNISKYIDYSMIKKFRSEEGFGLLTNIKTGDQFIIFSDGKFDTAYDLLYLEL